MFHMIFVIAVILFGLLALPFAKKQAAKKGNEFRLIKYLAKIAVLAVAVLIGGLINELYLNPSEKPVAPKPIHLPANIQNNLYQ
ncbi:unnamed protein product [Commensalibacter communis]|uniref:Uncharacterized protein n=2 Tax=Commensalibacter communis TaxID=2972786 RepID=A0A9W4TSA4_9PROT|nr:unnamed protein product [Commensalibacter communis]CAI3953030.1 unnamed protein product [Commensalibacter communis]CAI3954053.1 unnamed protein product [Commensalibacter communis]CAI3954110.1 unnamed protein product [Commensalibacter communis]CAI3955649.1 unnamed protein product [Commensalibacter communis]